MAAEGGRARQHVGEEVVRLRESELDGVLIDLLDRALLAVDRHRRRLDRVEVVVLVEILVPEDDVVGGEGLSVAPLHAIAELDGEGLAAVADIVALSDVRDRLGTGVVPEEEVVRAGGGPVAVPLVARPGEAAPPRAAVLADLLDRLDDDRVLAD